MLRALERRLEADEFHSARVPYDRTNDRGRDRTKQRRRKRPPLAVFDTVDGKVVKVGEVEQPEDPEIDVRGSLPAVVFEAVRGAGPAGV
jgi:hypothetical protein